ncbi:MAG: aldose 1-epimerase family protein, partial [Clostridia bacterium]|nr:aldose 1-epimerase family protein [Clostridia bacterium]
MLYVISDGKLTVKVSDRGAELQSVSLSGHEFLYDGKGLWNRRAPILFPIVGRLQNDSYRYKGREYKMGGHGFARDLDFTLSEKTESSLSLTLKENAETLKIYPFGFLLTVGYEVKDGCLSVSYTVKNPEDEPLLYSIGSHEAYFCPMTEGERFEDYSLVFEKAETAEAYEVAPPLLSGRTYGIFEKGSTLPLKYDFFAVDAIVLKEHKSRKITLTNSG